MAPQIGMILQLELAHEIRFLPTAEISQETQGASFRVSDDSSMLEYKGKNSNKTLSYLGACVVTVTLLRKGEIIGKDCYSS